jgi:3-hydroxyacyl-CoA dehydrogenase
MQTMGVKGQQFRAIKSVCVIGAGVMGQAIAAHMINAGLECTLLDMKTDGKDPNKIAGDAIKKIQTSKPSLLFSKTAASRINTGNIDDDLSCVKTCDLVVEAVFEKMDIKQSIFRKLEKLVGEETIIASNTSGLSIETMLQGLSPNFCKRFLVMHFFNPVRYLHLLEIVPARATEKKYIDAMMKFGEERLGKGVVVGKDTPNFVANRIGVYGMMETIATVLRGEYTVEEVDAVFGPALGRPKSAIFRTADVVGLDTFVHVAQNCFDNLPKDECHEIFAIPDFLRQMVKNGWLGQKSGQGFYKKDGEKILALDPKTLTYHEKAKVRFESMGAVRNLPTLKDKIATVAYADDRAGRLFFTLASKIGVYAANRLGEIADNIVDIDNALRWGFGWESGPFETWDSIGVRKSVGLMEKQGITVPTWVKEMLASGRESFYTEGPQHKVFAYDPKTKGQVQITTPPREWKLEILKRNKSNVVVDKDAFSLVDANNGALIVEFHSKMNAIDHEILHGINEGIDRCERGEFEALVLANDGANFSVGANLLLLYMGASQGMWKEIDDIVRLFQNTSKRLKYCSVPTVSAPFQLTLGGGCELSLWCDRIHASAETYIGLVEVGVGLIPGGGGNIEMVARTLKNTINSPTFVTEPFLMRALETVAMAKVATSALGAKDYLYLKESDTFSMNRRYLVHDAATVAVAMARAGYMPEAPRTFRLPGKSAYATFDMGLRSFLGGKFISEHDYKIALKVAHVMTGGNTNSYQEVSEDELLDLEREAFLSLCGEQKTMERIAYMLENNKPLRN